MPRIIDISDFDDRVCEREGTFVRIKMDGSVASGEAIWRMVLLMATKERAWCIRYDLGHPWRLVYCTSCTLYSLLPPPDETADVLVRSIDSLTRPKSLFGRMLADIRKLFGGRVTRSFWTLLGTQRIQWAASWPQRASDGAIVLFRGAYAGWDPSVPEPTEPAKWPSEMEMQRLFDESRKNVGDRHGNGF